ncbi:hypothetical protein [Burkholderia sp. BCC0398]|uniref:hypothetical protein n=1 Tax=Burkholderia sp. BCC0398 TaxID=2676297 RepID=UPI001FC82953|nr:hypothetical protein [Burkholderia sp. BCC0398]
MRIELGHECEHVAAGRRPEQVDEHRRARALCKCEQHFLDDRARWPRRIASGRHHADRIDRENAPVEYLLRAVRLAADPIDVDTDVVQRHRIADERHHVQALHEDLEAGVTDRFDVGRDQLR